MSNSSDIKKPAAEIVLKLISIFGNGVLSKCFCVSVLCFSTIEAGYFLRFLLNLLWFILPVNYACFKIFISQAAIDPHSQRSHYEI
jgi:hypothetical protein